MTLYPTREIAEKVCEKRNANAIPSEVVEQSGGWAVVAKEPAVTVGFDLASGPDQTVVVTKTHQGTISGVLKGPGVNVQSVPKKPLLHASKDFAETLITIADEKEKFIEEILAGKGAFDPGDWTYEPSTDMYTHKPWNLPFTGGSLPSKYRTIMKACWQAGTLPLPEGYLIASDGMLEPVKNTGSLKKVAKKLFGEDTPWKKNVKPDTLYQLIIPTYAVSGGKLVPYLGTAVQDPDGVWHDIKPDDIKDCDYDVAKQIYYVMVPWTRVVANKLYWLVDKEYMASIGVPIQSKQITDDPFFQNPIKKV